MYNVNMEDLLAELQNGADPANLADQFTTALNDALARQKEEKEKDAKIAGKREDMRNLLAAMHTYMINNIEDAELRADLDKMMRESSEDDQELDRMCKSIDSLLAFMVGLKNMENAFGKPDAPKAKITISDDADKVIADWLKMI